MRVRHEGQAREPTWRELTSGLVLQVLTKCCVSADLSMRVDQVAVRHQSQPLRV